MRENRGSIRVDCASTAAGWACDVVVGDDPGATRHEVTVRREDRDRLAPNVGPERLVEASFAFLLEREPRTSILRAFDLTEIGRYFPGYDDAIGDRVAGS